MSSTTSKTFAEMSMSVGCFFSPISKETYEEWNRSTGGKKLPERVTPKRAVTKAKKPVRKKTSRTRGKTRKR